MCSIFKYRSVVGRNFDYEVSYDEEIKVIHKDENPFRQEYDVIGIATGYSEYPLLYDGMNSNGLVVGGLAFTGNAYYIHNDANDKLHIPSYDFTFRMLSECGSVQEARDLLEYVKITDESYKDFENSDLHWFIADKDESIIVEQTKSGLNWYDGDVMTNNPPYPLQLDGYKSCEKLIGDYALEIYNSQKEWQTRGLETYALDGSYTSDGRFERLSYLKEKLEDSDNSFDNVSQAFHLCSSVEQVYGATPVNNKFEYTIYSVVYDMVNLKVYRRGYDSLSIIVNRDWYND